MTRDFGNEQDMYVQDKEHPTLGPTEEAQDVASLERIVVPMPAFNDPNNPLAAAGTVNMALSDHPVEHSEDYAEAERGCGTVEVQSPLSGQGAGSGSGGDEFTVPENRDDWTKADWQKQARAYEIATSGNLDTLKSRVEGFEAENAERDEYEKEVNAMSREELDKEAAKLDVDAETYSIKELLAAAVIATAYDEDVTPGDKTSEQ